MNSLQALAARCKADGHVTFNEYRSDYQSLEDFVDQGLALELMDAEEAPEILLTGVAVNPHFYPDSPVGYYSYWGSDLDKLIEKANRTLDRERDEDQKNSRP